MDFPRNEFFTRVTTDFETAYTMFLLDRRSIDVPAMRVVFYTACERMVKDSPLPGDPIMQLAILKHLEEEKYKVLDEYVESVEWIFGEVVMTNSANPH